MSARTAATAARQYDAALKQLGISAAYASAKVLGTGLRQAQRYSSGEAPVPAFDREAAALWNHPNQATREPSRHARQHLVGSRPFRPKPAPVIAM
jgi:hypothetical protein